MIKWSLILDEDALYQYLIPLFLNRSDKDITNAIKKYVGQHDIVLSDSLKSFYTEIYYGSDNNMLVDIFEAFINEASVYDDSPIIYVDHPDISKTEDSFTGIVSAIMAKLQHSNVLCLCSNKEHYSLLCHVLGKDLAIDSTQLDPPSINNRLTRNSNDFSYDLRSDDYSAYDEWIADLFRNESQITIIDPYFATTSGLQTFIKKYLPKIPRGATLNIYSILQYPNYDQMPSDNDWLNFKDHLSRKQLHFFLYEIPGYATEYDRKVHDRRIYLDDSNKHISIGHGLDAINWKRQRTEDCHISIDNDMSYLKSFKKEHKTTFRQIPPVFE